MADNKCDCNAVMQEVVDDIKNNMFSEKEINGVSIFLAEAGSSDIGFHVGYVILIYVRQYPCKGMGVSMQEDCIICCTTRLNVPFHSSEVPLPPV